MKKCKCCSHEMIGNGNGDFCQSCFAFLSAPANLDAWLNRKSSQQNQQAIKPHEHLQAEFDYICAICGEIVKQA